MTVDDHANTEEPTIVGFDARILTVLLLLVLAVACGVGQMRSGKSYPL